MTEIYLVLAGSIQEFNMWKEHHDIPVTHALYVSNVDVIDRLPQPLPPNTRVIRVGTFNLRKDAKDILQRIFPEGYDHSIS